MMSYSFMEEEGLLEAGYLGEAIPLWEHDLVLFDGKVDIATSFNADEAPQGVGETFLNNCTYDLQHEDGMSHIVDFDILDQLVDNDFDPLYLAQAKGQETNDTSSIVIQPVSPSSSDDSGVASPGSDELSSILSDPSPLYCNSGNPTDVALELGPHSYTTANFFSFPVEFPNELQVLDNLGSDLLGHFDSKVSYSLKHQLPIDTTDTLSISSSISSQESAASSLDTDLEPSTISKLPVVTTASPVLIKELKNSTRTSRCGRKSKISSLEEKKKRKRDQNKNAATRYRERKRQEAMEKEAEFNVLDTKNKSLKDKVSQISREINYLKELMIEVYTIKGLIS